MAKKIWKVTIDGTEHQIELDHGTISGKRKITLDGTIIEESSKPIDTGSDHAFKIGDHVCTVHILAKTFNFKYDLSVDGVSVSSGTPTQIKEISPSSPYTPPAAAIQEKIKLENQFKAGANWFFWIAGLSLVNSVVFLLEGDINFVVGLGITQIVDILANFIGTEINPEIAPFVKLVGLVINLILLGIFVFFGVMARKKKKWAFITGMVLYGLDVLILIWAQDVFSIIFHALALYWMYQGLRAVNKLAEHSYQEFDTTDMFV